MNIVGELVLQLFGVRSDDRHPVPRHRPVDPIECRSKRRQTLAGSRCCLDGDVGAGGDHHGDLACHLTLRFT